jgi:D-alanyl-D-alanine carboxypeptidase (penicillin-binding protein 5/6)
MVSAQVAAQLNIDSPSAVLIEGSTGTIIYDKNKDERVRPASITKIMTLLLIFEALDAGKITLNDEVTVSEHAASMGGSQVYLEPFEVQNVDTMLKCISIASANDASVAMAEMIAGSEEEFVAMMNDRAKELGMANTNFVNCCGLDTDNHYSSAYDVALMSRELITKHPQISKYSTVWMDTITHTTKKGTSEFGLTNTNKMVRFYQGITGLKTGSTSLAKYCLSATAKKENMDLIAVIMGSPDTKTRFLEASKLLNYGFANYSIYTDNNTDTVLTPVKVSRGVMDAVQGKTAQNFSYLCSKGKSTADIRKEVILYEKVDAPVPMDTKIGEIIYYYGNDKIGTIDILSTEEVEKAGLKDYFVKVLKKYFVGN